MDLGMSAELILARFDPNGSATKEFAMPLLAKTSQRVLTELGWDKELVSASPNGETIDIELPGGTAEIHTDHAKFPIDNLDTLTLRLIFEIALAGNFMIITEGGKYAAILLKAEQRAQVPADWHPSKATTPICHSPDELGILLQSWLAAQKDYMTRSFGERSTSELTSSADELIRIENRSNISVPGTEPRASGQTVYIEVLGTESPVKHQKRIYGFNDACENPSVSQPQEGILMSQFWRLITPAGKSFFAYRFGGDIDGWRQSIQRLGVAQGRTIGRIENFDTFVQVDGNKYPISACDCAKLAV
jgi:hypothetical protein